MSKQLPLLFRQVIYYADWFWTKLVIETCYLSLPEKLLSMQTSLNPFLHNLISFMTQHFCGKTSPTASPHLSPWWTSQDHIWLCLQLLFTSFGIGFFSSRYHLNQVGRYIFPKWAQMVYACVLQPLLEIWPDLPFTMFLLYLIHGIKTI